MAKQATMMKLTGSIGNITFYQHKNGNFYAREKPRVQKERFLHAPEFEASRKASAEFGQASRISGIVRKALQPVLDGLEGFGHSKLTALFREVILSDGVNEPGQREFFKGDHGLYRGRELGKHALMHQMGGLPLFSSEGEGRYVHFDFGHLHRELRIPRPIGANLYAVQVHGIEILDNGNGGSRTEELALPPVDLGTAPAVFGIQTLDFGSAVPENTVRIAAVSLRFLYSAAEITIPYREVGGVCLLGRIL